MRTTPRRNVDKRYKYRAISIWSKCYMYFDTAPVIVRVNGDAYWIATNSFTLNDSAGLHGKPRKGTKFTIRTMTNSLRRLA